MTSDDVRVKFNAVIKGDIVMLPDGSTVGVEFFANLFKDAPANPTYNELIAIDAGKMGYAGHFAIWKQQGILV